MSNLWLGVAFCPRLEVLTQKCTPMSKFKFTPYCCNYFFSRKILLTSDNFQLHSWDDAAICQEYVR